MKNISIALLFVLFALPFSGYSGVVINIAHGGPNGYQDVTITTDDGGNEIINCAQPGYSSCPYLSAAQSKTRSARGESEEYRSLIQIAAASINNGLLSGKMVSANSKCVCEWIVADRNDLTTFQIRINDLK
jgi:hypothetical protein